MRFEAWIAALLWGMAAAPCGAIAQPPAAVPDATAATETLHVSSRVVEIAAVVSEKNGEPRAGLKKEDFVLKQDGKEQAIRYFSQGDETPLTMVLLVDTSGSQATFLGDETRACDVFLETMLVRPQDRAALVQVDARVTLLAGMTNAPNRLHLSLMTIRPRPEEMVATRLYDAIHDVATEVLAKERGRKAIILLSDGGDQGSRLPQSIAIADAEGADIPIYSISYSAWSEFDQQPARRTIGAERSGVLGDPGLQILKKLSESTGGRVFRVAPGVTLKHIFEEIAQELRTQYEIGYAPPPDTEPNQFHKLELRTREKDLKVQARTGFFAKP